MRIVRRFVFTAAFLVTAVLMIRAAKQYGDFLFMFYPGIMREIQVILADFTAKMDYLVWERLALIALVWAGITLVLDILLQENLLRWISGITAVVAFLLCAYVGLNGLNQYAPSVAEGMRLDVRDDYGVTELKQAALYYRASANAAADTVKRNADGTFEAADFEILAEQAGSGMKNMVRTSYVFGGSTVPPKKLGFLSKYGIYSIYSCFTGECCINPNVDDAALPFLISREMARRMSISRDEDAEFLAVLSCTASDSLDYRYSGYLMAYRFCMEALNELDETEALTVAAGENEALKADLAACRFKAEVSLGTQWLSKVEELDKTEPDTAEVTANPPDLAALLVSWYIREITPTETAPHFKPVAA